MGSPLAIGILYSSNALSSDALRQSLTGSLSKAADDSQEDVRQYTLTQLDSQEDFLQFVKQSHPPVDCCIFQASATLQSLFEQLQAQAAFFPAVVLSSSPPAEAIAVSSFNYHPATLELSIDNLSQIHSAIEQAIGQFIQLLPVSQSEDAPALKVPDPQTRQTVVAQQQRLAEKLKERLDYLGVYYKRNPQNFLRHLTQPQKDDLLNQLQIDYRTIILSYFSGAADLNQRIDHFVDIAFFADIPVSQIVEIHMNLMDEFSTQLKLEGRSDEVLQDYRLTLIDTIAHLCEMYRRSIPRGTITELT